jgi:hypothetical protein
MVCGGLDPAQGVIPGGLHKEAGLLIMSRTEGFSGHTTLLATKG